jgi:molecular chaperone GrpE
MSDETKQQDVEVVVEQPVAEEKNAGQPAELDPVVERDALREENGKLRLDLMLLARQSEDLKRQSDDCRIRLEDSENRLKEYILSHRKAVTEFDAAKDRMRRDMAGQFDRVKAKFLGDLIEVLDNLDRSIAIQPPEDTRGKALFEGVRMVREQFMAKLRDNGVERADTRGKRFDPEFHEALSTCPTSDASLEGVIAQEFRAGYLLEGKLLRPAQVVVFKVSTIS